MISACLREIFGTNLFHKSGMKGSLASEELISLASVETVLTSASAREDAGLK